MSWLKNLMSIGKGAIFNKEEIVTEVQNGQKTDSIATSETKIKKGNDSTDTSLHLTEENTVAEENIIEKNLQKIYPRLKAGHIAAATSMTASVINDGQPEEIVLPESALMAGLDLGPDFTCCFAMDIGVSYQLLTRGHLAQSKYSEDELYKICVKNFLAQYGDKMQLHKTKFPGVRMMRIDGNMEANSFLINQVWSNVCKSLKTESIYVAVPLQDIVICWKTLSEEGHKELVKELDEVIQREARSRKVSDYLFEFKEGKMIKLKKIFCN